MNRTAETLGAANLFISVRRALVGTHEKISARHAEKGNGFVFTVAIHVDKLHRLAVAAVSAVA